MKHVAQKHSDLPTLTGAARITAREPRAARAFTLIELLTVIAVISILLTIVLVAGSGVLADQRVKLTKNVLINLDRALDEYITSVGAVPAYGVVDESNNPYRKVPGDDNNVQAYGTGTSNKHCARPDAAAFIKQTRGYGMVDGIITGIPERFLRLTVTAPNSPNTVEGDPTPSVVDAWSSTGWPAGENGDAFAIEQQQVIYYVHPDNTLAQDLFGQCVNRRPYFMSAGPDKLYGLTNEPLRDGATVEEAESFTKDNVYSYPVGPIKKGMSSREWKPL